MREPIMAPGAESFFAAHNHALARVSASLRKPSGPRDAVTLGSMLEEMTRAAPHVDFRQDSMHSSEREGGPVLKPGAGDGVANGPNPIPALERRTPCLSLQPSHPD